MNVLSSIFSICSGLIRALRRLRIPKRQQKQSSETFSDLGVYVEVDCRACGQFNRVPSNRLRDRPKCGRCKKRLMPKKRVVLCRVSPMKNSLSAELDTVWMDEDRLWQSLANHIMPQAKERAEATGANPRAAN